MGRARKPKVAKLDAASTAVGNTTLSETTNAVHVVGSPVTRSSKLKSGKNLPESSNPSGGDAIMEKISVEESEKDEQLVENLGSNPSIVEKIDFLVQSAQEFSSKGIKQPFGKGDKALELNHTSQYLESQKKVEALTKENHDLSVKLASTQAKLEAYENMNALRQMKEMMFATNLAKANEAFVKFTSQLTSGKGDALPAIAAAATGEGINPAVAAQQTASSPQATTTGQGTTSTVSAEPSAPLLQAPTGEGTNPAVAAEQTASLPQATTTGQGTSSTFSAELELGRSKRVVKKKVR